MYSDKLMNSTNVKDSIILSLCNTLREREQDNE
jgi:hypothetical protein